MTALDPLEPYAGPGIYLHVPFCSEICPYCDFAVTKGDRLRRTAYVRGLLAEIEIVAQAGEAAPFDTIYFGGGTPSLLAEEELAQILESLHSRLGALPNAWIFLEANPEDVTTENLAAWRRLGVRTLSLGVQSFDDEELRFLGRRHDGKQARRSVELALEAGFSTVSVDLIYGLPDQTEAAWRRNLQTALDLHPDHLSCYQLTVHEGTLFGVLAERGDLQEMPDPGQAKLFRMTHEVLAEGGLPGYEVSNFARTPKHQSRHNRKYWHHQPYLGLGPSAHSFDGVRRRWWNERRLRDWGRRVDSGERPVAAEEKLSAGDLAREELMLGLRTAGGVDLERFRGRHGVDLEEVAGKQIQSHVDSGRAAQTSGRLRLKLDGWAVADGVVLDLVLALDRVLGE